MATRSVFWIPILVGLEIVLILALVLNWRARERRNLLLLGIGVHVLVRLWTFIYFVPEILAYSSVAPDGPYSAELAARTELWGQLGWIRRALIGLDSVAVMLSLLRPGPLTSASAPIHLDERHALYAAARSG